MLWPNHLITALERGLGVTPVEGLTAEHVYRTLLDEAARRAVWRARGNPADIGPAFRLPYTPIGSVTAECVNGLARQLCFRGQEWSDAVDLIHDFMEKHADQVCDSFKDEAEPYPCNVGFDNFPDAEPLDGKNG
jgi:hypothetical protein